MNKRQLSQLPAIKLDDIKADDYVLYHKTLQRNRWGSYDDNTHKFWVHAKVLKTTDKFIYLSNDQKFARLTGFGHKVANKIVPYIHEDNEFVLHNNIANLWKSQNALQHRIADVDITKFDSATIFKINELIDKVGAKSNV